MSRGLGASARRGSGVRLLTLLFGTSSLCAIAAVTLVLPAQAEVLFTATSSAAASEVSVNSGAIPLSTENTAGGPSAQTRLDSNGTSQAYAASPDPSGSGARAQPLACGQAGGQVPFPLPPQVCTYPLFAATDRGEPEQSAGGPGNTVTARSEDQSAYAAADLGQAPAASAHVSSLSKISADGTITTTAEATADQLGVNGAITISGFHVLAEARRGTDGKVKTRHDLSAGTVTVAGQSFGLSDGTFTLPGGAGAPVPADAVFSLMKSVGVRGAFQQATENKNGVVAPSLSLSYSVPATPGTKAVEVTVTLGRASAQLSATAAGDPATVVTVAPPPPAPGDGGTVPPTSGPAAPGTTPLGPSLGGSGSQGAPVGGPPAVIATTGPAQPTAAASRQPELHHLGNIYLAVVAAGLFTLGTATGVRLLGVRFT